MSTTTTAEPPRHAPRRHVPEPRRSARSPYRQVHMLLSNHANVLAVLASDPAVRVREIAQRVDLTERAVQGILGDLVDAGLVTRVRRGRRNTYRLHLDRRIPGPIEARATVRELVELVTGRSLDRAGAREDER